MLSVGRPFVVARALALVVVLQAFSVSAAGPTSADENTITVTATQQGSDLAVSWTPVPQSQWPPSNTGGPWTGQVYFVSAWDMNAPGPRLVHFCNGTSALATATGQPRTTETNCVLRNLPLGKTYNVFVRSWVFNSGSNTGMAGWGDLWERGGITLCCSVPSSPRDLQVVESGSNALTAAWSPPAENGGASTVSYVATLNPGAQVCTTTATECRYTDLKPGVAYSVSLLSMNDAGRSAQVESAVATLRPPPLSAPRAVSVTAAAKSLRVTWSSPPRATGQVISRYIAKATPTGKSCATTKTSCTIAGVPGGRTYTVTVTLVSGDGVRTTSSASKPVTTPAIRKPIPRPAPAAPAPEEAAKPAAPVS